MREIGFVNTAPVTLFLLNVFRSASLPRNAHKPAIPPKPRSIAMKMSPTKSDEESSEDHWNNQSMQQQQQQQQYQQQQQQQHQRRISQENANHHNKYRSGKILTGE